jgi:hypothetical protein
MIKVSTMLYVTEDGKASDEITERFLEENQVRTVLTKMVGNDLKQMKFGSFLVDLLIYEVEEQFIKYLFAQQAVSGLIYCGCIDHPDTMWWDIKTLLGDDTIVVYNDMLTGEDRTADVLERPDKFNVMSLVYSFDHYEADVYELDDEDEEDDEYFTTDESPTHVC